MSECKHEHCYWYRRELLKRVKDELEDLTFTSEYFTAGRYREEVEIKWDDVVQLMDRLIEEAKLP